MEIIGYRSDHLQVLTDLYNNLTSTVPHCYEALPEELAGAFTGDSGYGSLGNRMEADAVFVACDPDPVGFVHAGEGFDKEDLSVPQGIIRFLAYPRGRRDAGQALLEHAEAWLKTAGHHSALMFPQAYRYPFYHFSHAFLSNHLEHIQSLLLVNGYEECGGEVFLSWPDMEPAKPRGAPGLDIDLGVQLKPGRGRLPGIYLEARHHGKKIGECVCLSAGEFSNREEVEDWVFTQWLGVAGTYQGIGLGRFLLASALGEALSIGYRNAAISTAWDNHRALLFYANFGYRAVDWTRQFRRTLP